MSTRISTDPIADMLTRIRNAGAVRKTEVSMPYSNIKASIAELLTTAGFVSSTRVEGEGKLKVIVVTIAEDGSSPRITELKRLSTPGRRLYVGSKEIPTVKQGRGIIIISTPKGIMTGKEAKAKGVGGELLCSVF